MTQLKRTLQEIAFYPPHDPRTASSEYRKTHDHLVVELDTPCWVCGVKHSDVIKMTKANQKLFQLETHHAELEWAAEKAFEGNTQMLDKLVSDLHQYITTETPEALQQFLDSEGNMLVLCATHHRGARTGIHMISYPIWKLQRYQYGVGNPFVFVPQPTVG